jgi:hypothetical protein
MWLRSQRLGGGWWVRVPREFGLAGVELEPGDHVCGFYYGDDERDAILLPYLEAGLREGDRCLGVVDTTDPAAVLRRLDPELDAPGCAASRQLLLWPSTETYLRGGRFSPDWMSEFWEEQVRAAAADGYDLARVVGEMSWLSRVELDRKLLVAYEGWAHRFAALHGQVLLCLYDVSRLGSGILVDLLKTHRKLLLGGLVLENPHHLTGSEFATTSP